MKILERTENRTQGWFFLSVHDDSVCGQIPADPRYTSPVLQSEPGTNTAQDATLQHSTRGLTLAPTPVFMENKISKDTDLFKV